MNQLISPLWIKRLIIIGTIAAVIKVTMLGALFFLPHQGVDRVDVEEASLYQSYKPSKPFALKGKKTAPVVKKAPVYQLKNLTLQGLYDDPKTPFIAVEDAKKISLVGLGESFKGYKLIDVKADRAIFEKSQKQYELLFKEKALKKGAISVAEPEIIQDDAAVFVKRKEIKHYAKNFDAIWKNIKIKEIIKDKRLKGFEVTWVKKDSLFAKLGLIKGDVITGVNGKTLKSVSQVFKIYNNMDKMDSLKLMILRDNQEKELEYEVF
ncbi:MAG: PDZ domain-containing protein [Campylobacterota bacterium]|nr:PDZ domain-containing protein [Campylobacterota bacterium]